MSHQVPTPPPVRILQTKTKKAPQRPKRKVKKAVAPKRKRLPVRKELSAGGVALREERGTWLVALLKTEHKRGEVWVLPKGHVEQEQSERVSDAARREVEEETGLKDLVVRDQLGVARFTFQAEGTLIKKTVHYYLMITQQKTLYPQEEEYFIDAAWFPIDVAIRTLEYDTDQKVVARAIQKITGKRVPVPHSKKKSSARVRVHA